MRITVSVTIGEPAFMEWQKATQVITNVTDEPSQADVQMLVAVAQAMLGEAGDHIASQGDQIVDIIVGDDE